MKLYLDASLSFHNLTFFHWYVLPVEGTCRRNLLISILKQKILVAYNNSKNVYNFVSHQIFLKTFKTFELAGIHLKLFHSFVRLKKFKNRIEYEKSNRLEASSGLPRGSSLGPFFCETFTNYMPEANAFVPLSTLPGSRSRSKTAQDLSGFSGFPARFERFELFGRFFGKTAQTAQILLKKPLTNRSFLAVIFDRFFKQDLSSF